MYVCFLTWTILSLPTLLGKIINKHKTILNELSELVNAESERNEIKNKTNLKTLNHTKKLNTYT